MSLLSVYSVFQFRIFKLLCFSLAWVRTSVAAALSIVQFWTSKTSSPREVCHGFDLALTFGKYPEALQEMRFRLGPWGSGPSWAMKIPQRMRRLSLSHRRSWSLVCQRTRKIDGNLWMTQWKRLLVNSLYLKIPLQAPNGPCQTLLLGEMGETLEIKSTTHF